MKEVKLTIDGKEVRLTDEQLRMLGIEPEKKRKNPFERVAENDRYYFISYFGDVNEYRQANDCEDDALFNNLNYFNDKRFAQQVALRQLLYRKLLKFAYENKCEDMAEWNGKNFHWVVRYIDKLNKFDLYCQNCYKSQDVYFSSEEGARRAIHEVIEPFMKEHPDFVW